MKRTWLSLPLLAFVACRGQELTVFEALTSMAGGGVGGAGSGAGAFTAGASGGTSGATGASDTAGGLPDDGEGGVAGEGAAGAGAGPGAGVGAGGEPGVVAGMTCKQHPDCPPSWRCEKTSCDAASGVCEPRPLFLEPTPLPVCGCDGITYWNDSVRRQIGPTLQAPGECQANAQLCNAGTDCKGPYLSAYASCSHLVAPGELCGHGPGVCWVLPPNCVPNGDPSRWQECRPPNSPDPPPPCIDTCTAIRSERPHAPPHRGDCK